MSLKTSIRCLIQPSCAQFLLIHEQGAKFARNIAGDYTISSMRFYHYYMHWKDLDSFLFALYCKCHLLVLENVVLPVWKFLDKNLRFLGHFCLCARDVLVLSNIFWAALSQSHQLHVIIIYENYCFFLLIVNFWYAVILATKGSVCFSQINYCCLWQCIPSRPLLLYGLASERDTPPFWSAYDCSRTCFQHIVTPMHSLHTFNVHSRF
jgi:hypothetical protein